MPEEIKVERLIDEARQGNVESLGALFECYRSYLRFLAGIQINARLAGKISPSDVVQESFLNAKLGFANFRGHHEKELVSWLRQILANNLVRIIRRYSTEKRNIQLEVELKDSLEQSSVAISHIIADTNPSPSEHASGREQSVLLVQFLSQLPEDYREVLVLRHIHGFSFPDISKRMNRTLDSVKNVWARAIKRLRDELEDQR